MVKKLIEVNNFVMKCFTSDELEPETYLVIGTGFSDKYVIGLATPHDEEKLRLWEMKTRKQLKDEYGIVLNKKVKHYVECDKCHHEWKTELVENGKCPACKHPYEVAGKLIINLMQQTFAQSDEEAEKIVDLFIEENPQILKTHRKNFLYRI